MLQEMDLARITTKKSFILLSEYVWPGASDLRFLDTGAVLIPTSDGTRDFHIHDSFCEASYTSVTCVKAQFFFAL